MVKGGQACENFKYDCVPLSSFFLGSGFLSASGKLPVLSLTKAGEKCNVHRFAVDGSLRRLMNTAAINMGYQ